MVFSGQSEAGHLCTGIQCKVTGQAEFIQANSSPSKNQSEYLQELDNDPGKKIKFSNDWVQASVTIKIPTKSKEDDVIPFSVGGFHFCPLIEVMWSAFADVQASVFHLLPFKCLWNDLLNNHQN